MNRAVRTPVIAGNWKMNMTRKATSEFIAELRPLALRAACGVALCVPFTDLDAAVEAAEGSNIIIGAQNCHWAASGAFTGEVSAEMLTEIGTSLCIIGHSERRQYFGETDETVNARLKAVLAAGMMAIVCVGETLAERESGKTFDVIARQVRGALSGVTETEMRRVIFAYEPVWAIGTGRTATAEQANEVCAFIRSTVEGLYTPDAALALRIQYGGSMNAKNASELLAQSDIDGGLIGGASLKIPDFTAILAAASEDK